VTDQVTKTDREWKAELTPAQFKVLRKEGTERAGTGPLAFEKREGVYRCGGCHAELFSSDTKYESGSGWPSYYAPISDDAVGTKQDRKLFMSRTEVHCDRCGGHLGHVFPDGPEPTGLRYCLNSAALEFVPEGTGDVVPGAPDA
jgi:peptide-methionine (R)-S-oxide reductase